MVCVRKFKTNVKYIILVFSQLDFVKQNQEDIFEFNNNFTVRLLFNLNLSFYKGYNIIPLKL